MGQQQHRTWANAKRVTAAPSSVLPQARGPRPRPRRRAASSLKSEWLIRDLLRRCTVQRTFPQSPNPRLLYRCLPFIELGVWSLTQCVYCKTTASAKPETRSQRKRIPGPPTVLHPSTTTPPSLVIALFEPCVVRHESFARSTLIIPATAVKSH